MLSEGSILCANTAPKLPVEDAASTHKYFVADSLIRLQNKGSFNNKSLIVSKAFMCVSCGSYVTVFFGTSQGC